MRWLICWTYKWVPEMIGFAEKIDDFLRWLICLNHWGFLEMIDFLNERVHVVNKKISEFPWMKHEWGNTIVPVRQREVFYLRLLTGLSKLWYLRRRRKYKLPIGQKRDKIHKLYNFHPENNKKDTKNTDCTLFFDERVKYIFDETTIIHKEKNQSYNMFRIMSYKNKSNE